jgi:hypothetical protein
MQGAQFGLITQFYFMKNKKNHLSKAAVEVSL